MRFPIILGTMFKRIFLALLLFWTFFYFQYTRAEFSDDTEQAVHNFRDKNYGFYPRPNHGYVTDLADLLSPKEEELIEKWLWQVEARKGIEIVVVTIYSIYNYPGTDNRSIETFAQGLFNQYGIGNLQKNDGILFLIAKEDRKARIELGTYYGLQKNIAAERIMNHQILPKFRKEEYSRGITTGVKALMWEFARMYPITPSLVIFWSAIICFLLLSAYNLFREGKKGWGWAVLGIVIVIIIWIIQLLADIFKYMPTDSSDHWESGGFGGGFGGGSSGGGGATGSW